MTTTKITLTGAINSILLMCKQFEKKIIRQFELTYMNWVQFKFKKSNSRELQAC